MGTQAGQATRIEGSRVMSSMWDAGPPARQSRQQQPAVGSGRQRGVGQHKASNEHGPDMAGTPACVMSTAMAASRAQRRAVALTRLLNAVHDGDGCCPVHSGSDVNDELAAGAERRVQQHRLDAATGSGLGQGQGQGQGQGRGQGQEAEDTLQGFCCEWGRLRAGCSVKVLGGARASKTTAFLTQGQYDGAHLVCEVQA